jgi:hypothetical protein
MPAITQNRIETAWADPETYTVRIGWRNGAETVASFKHLIGQGVFENLRDPEFFQQVKPDRDGRVLTWPGEIDVSSDGLWFSAHPEDISEEGRAYYSRFFAPDT